MTARAVASSVESGAAKTGNSSVGGPLGRKARRVPATRRELPRPPPGRGVPGLWSCGRVCRPTRPHGIPQNDGVSTIVFVHAHPDDEASATACSMAMATDRATEWSSSMPPMVTTGGGARGPGRGRDHGRPTPAPGGRRERRRDRRRGPLVDYADSGMHGWAENDAEGSFRRQHRRGGRATGRDPRRGRTDVVVGYDFHGNYGHPDHVKVHHVTRRAVAPARRFPRYLESTINRDLMRRQRDQAIALGRRRR